MNKLTAWLTVFNASRPKKRTTKETKKNYCNSLFHNNHKNRNILKKWCTLNTICVFGTQSYMQSYISCAYVSKVWTKFKKKNVEDEKKTGKDEFPHECYVHYILNWTVWIELFVFHHPWHHWHHLYIPEQNIQF